MVIMPGENATKLQTPNYLNGHSLSGASGG